MIAKIVTYFGYFAFLVLGVYACLKIRFYRKESNRIDNRLKGAREALRRALKIGTEEKRKRKEIEAVLNSERWKIKEGIDNESNNDLADYLNNKFRKQNDLD